jgi:hypothetical protein
MTTLHPTFRRLLRRYIPQLRDQDLNRYEGLTALRHELVVTKHIAGDSVPSAKRKRKGAAESYSPTTPSDIDKDIAIITEQVQAIFKEPAKAYEASLHLWTGRRQLILQQSNFFQIPLSRRKWKAIWNFYWTVRRETIIPITKNRIKSLSLAKVISFIVLVAILLCSLFTLTPKQKSESATESQIEERQ